MRMKGRHGTFALLALTMGLAAGCATTPSESPAQAAAPAAVTTPERLLPDQTLANAVYSKLDANPVYYYRHVDVRVDGGIAYLSGYVWSTDAIYAARRITQSVPGVTGVVTSQLELERNGRGNGATR